MSGLLHALVAMCPSQVGSSLDTSSTEEPLPITSYVCQWKKPRKRKESNQMVSEVAFQKHVYGRQVKHTLQPLATFDPWPPEYHGTAPEQMKDFLKKVKGKGIGVSVLLDTDVRVWEGSCEGHLVAVPVPATEPHIPSRKELMERVTAFKQALELSPQQIRELEQSTRDQHLSDLWYSARRYRLTASMFGTILQLKPTTPPDSLVKQLLHPKPFSTNATQWGKDNEPIALQEYVKYQLRTNRMCLVTCSAGFLVSENHPFLGASPDAYAFDPSSSNQFGLVEIKCPYKYRDLTPEDAAQQTDFCCKVSAEKQWNSNVSIHPLLRFKVSLPSQRENGATL